MDHSKIIRESMQTIEKTSNKFLSTDVLTRLKLINILLVAASPIAQKVLIKGYSQVSPSCTSNTTVPESIN